MIPIHKDYSVEIKKLKFEPEKGIRYPQTALVKFVVGNKEQPVVELMGHIPEKEIYDAIDRGEEIRLDNCYVDKFSLKDYRVSRNKDPREKVVIRGFSARDALFGGLAPLDFSHAVFEGKEFSLEGASIQRGDMSFESARFKTREVNFHNSRLPEGHFNFKNVNCETANVSFKNCEFGAGEKDFQYVQFGTGQISFINSWFADGNVNFINSNFGTGEVSFKVARFGVGKVDFHFASFNNTSISFERTEFGDGRIDFRTVEFGAGRVNFNRSVFGAGEKSFDECSKDGGKLNLKRVDFGTGNISFEEVMLENVDVSLERSIFREDSLSFYKSWFGSLSLRFCHLDGYVDLRVMQSRHIDLSNTVVRDIIDMNPHDFVAGIDTLTLAGMRLMGRIYLDWNRSKVKKMVYSQKNFTHRVIAEQFRILKENFQTQGLYNDEDKAYVEFKRAESKSILLESVERNQINALYQYPLYWFKALLFDKAGLYATSPVRVLVTMLASFVVFSLLYVLLMAVSSADIVASVDDQLTDLARAFYHSAITFLTIGYGDHYPFGAIRWVSAVEGFFGLFLMSYFTVAFVRKVLR